MELANLAQAAQLHAHLIKTGLVDGDNAHVRRLLSFTALSPSGDLPYARSIFDSLRLPNTGGTNVLLHAYAKTRNDSHEALRLYASLRHRGLAPDRNARTYTFLLNACSRLRDLRRGREVHGLALKRGVASHLFLKAPLVQMYSSCEDLENALMLFDETLEKDVGAWTRVISALVDRGRCQEALDLFSQVRDVEGVQPDARMLTKVLEACAALKALPFGKEAHEVAKRNGLHRESSVATALLDMYLKCGCVDTAREAFDEMLERDVAAWTAMVGGLVSHGRYQEALDLFSRMTDVEGLGPKGKVLISALRACKELRALSFGKEVHQVAKRAELLRDRYVATSLLDMYARCGCIDAAREVFDEMPERHLVTWKAMITGLVMSHRRYQEALDLFSRMTDVEGVQPDEELVVVVLKACKERGALSFGKEVHEVAKRNGLHRESYVATSLLDMYARCGCIETAREVFDEMPERHLVTWKAMITGLVMSHRRYQEALDLFCRMMEVEGVQPDGELLAVVLKACKERGALSFGKKVHEIAKRNGLHRERNVATSLLDMYAKCGCIDTAREVFEEMLERGFAAWTTMILGLSSHSRYQEALDLFFRMANVEKVDPDARILNAIVVVCKELGVLSFVKEVHEVAKRTGLNRDRYVATPLMDAYAKCGCIDTAKEVFDEMLQRDLNAWTAMIVRLVSHGRYQEALHLFSRMTDVERVGPNIKILTEVLVVCKELEVLPFGKEVHEVAKKSGLHRDLYVGTSLLDMYAKCKCINTAREVFDEMLERDMVAWKTMIMGLMNHGQYQEVLHLFSRMTDVERVDPNGEILTAVLGACKEIGALSFGKEVHEVAKRRGLHRESSVATALMDMYAKCGCIDNAREVFDEMLKRDVSAWLTMIVGLSRHGRRREALDLFRQMRDAKRLVLDEQIIVAVLFSKDEAGELNPEVDGSIIDLLACDGHLNEGTLSLSLTSGVIEPGNLMEAMQLHAHIIKTGQADGDSIPLDSLLAFSVHSPLGDLSYSLAIFDSLLCPTTNCTNHLICAYAKCSSNPRKALRLFASLQLRGIAPDPDAYTYKFLLDACCQLQARHNGQEVHGLALKSGLASETVVQRSLVYLYSSCGDLESALDVFNRMPSRDVRTWTLLIDGTGKGGRPLDALALFERMEKDFVDPNDTTLVSVLWSCGELGALSFGRKVHEVAKTSGLHIKGNVAAALLLMYARCGCIDSARRIFDEMPKKNVVACTAMIEGLSKHGQFQEALDLFNRMRDVEGVEPNGQTISTVLHACRSADQVEEGYQYFIAWKKHVTKGMKPKLCDYGRMVHVLAHAGYLDEAEEFIKEMPVEPDDAIWRTLISASRSHGDADRAQRLASEQLLQINPTEF